MLLIVMVAIIYIAINHKKFFPRVRNPEELRARLAGEYYASSDSDISISGYSNISDIDEDLALAEEMYQREQQIREETAAEAVIHEDAPLEAGWKTVHGGRSGQHEKFQ